MATLVIILIFWGICGLVAASMFESRGRSGCSGFAFGFLFGPLGILIAAVTPPTQQVVQNQQRELDLVRLERGDLKKCPYCAEFVKKEATVCRFCGKDLPPIKPTEPRVEVDLFSEGADMYSQRYLRITSQRIQVKNTSYPLEDITSATVEQTGSKFFVKVVTKDGRKRNIGYSSNKQSAAKIADIILRAKTGVTGQARQPENIKTGDIEMSAQQPQIASHVPSQSDSLAHPTALKSGETAAPSILVDSEKMMPRQVAIWGMTKAQWAVIAVLAIGVVIVFCTIIAFALSASAR